ncbi:Aste57867_23073 [Aphanomyces stellatus]|uniref:Aste57867_23073 protein n=1 Tax=Aphanomyces stellatus TaxID=120398 RepID=A0A485LNN0_9STRA|nr:hypothetical protein As57867_023002 [Aphanomyces stellatus]VFT99721.1 Aste57867_23073 [Aphanomyces stellatus]
MPSTSTHPAKINHLRCPGSSLHHTTSHRHLAGSEAKLNPPAIADNAVVEAFGLGKCPRLVRLLGDESEAVLLHTLTSLAGVLSDPRDVVLCFDEHAHVLEPLAKLVYHANDAIQERTAECLKVISSHANGRAELISSRTMRKILKAFVRTEEQLMVHLFDTALNVGSLLSGAQEMTQNGYVNIVMDKLKHDLSDAVLLRTLRLVKIFVNDGMSGTVLRVVESNGVETVSRCVFSKVKPVQVAALQLIGAMMYLDRGRDHAMAHGVVKKLTKVLMDKEPAVCVASAGALMVLAIHDDAKREFHEGGAIPGLLQLLYRQDFGIQLNVLKLVAAIASYPPARQVMRTPQMEKIMIALTDDPSELLARTAKVALHAVVWMP